MVSFVLVLCIMMVTHVVSVVPHHQPAARTFDTISRRAQVVTIGSAPAQGRVMLVVGLAPYGTMLRAGRVVLVLWAGRAVMVGGRIRDVLTGGVLRVGG